MTMQVSLVGTDGIILASDEQRMFLEGGTQDSSQTPKMLINQGVGIVLAFSGCEVSETIARNISDGDAGFDFENQARKLELFAEQKYRAWFDSDDVPFTDAGEILIVSCRPARRLYSLDMNKKRCILRNIRDKRAAGFVTNSARFFRGLLRPAITDIKAEAVGSSYDTGGFKTKPSRNPWPRDHHLHRERNKPPFRSGDRGPQVPL